MSEKVTTTPDTSCQQLVRCTRYPENGFPADLRHWRHHAGTAIAPKQGPLRPQVHARQAGTQCRHICGRGGAAAGSWLPAATASYALTLGTQQVDAQRLLKCEESRAPLMSGRTCCCSLDFCSMIMLPIAISLWLDAQVGTHLNHLLLPRLRLLLLLLRRVRAWPKRPLCLRAAQRSLLVLCELGPFAFAAAAV